MTLYYFLIVWQIQTGNITWSRGDHLDRACLGFYDRSPLESFWLTFWITCVTLHDCEVATTRVTNAGTCHLFAVCLNVFSFEFRPVTMSNKFYGNNLSYHSLWFWVQFSFEKLILFISPVCWIMKAVLRTFRWLLSLRFSQWKYISLKWKEDFFFFGGGGGYLEMSGCPIHQSGVMTEWLCVNDCIPKSKSSDLVGNFFLGEFDGRSPRRSFHRCLCLGNNVCWRCGEKLFAALRWQTGERILHHFSYTWKSTQ